MKECEERSHSDSLFKRRYVESDQQEIETAFYKAFQGN
jgi:ribonuclease Z